MRTLDLLRNHPWNMQATIFDRGDAHAQSRFEVVIDAIEGFGLSKTTRHTAKTDAYMHARTVLGMNQESKPDEQP